MNQETMTKAIIESVIQHFLKEMERDPDRALRKLVDMGEHFANGKFQTRWFLLIQDILTDEKSIYYALMRRVASQVDHKTLKTFGLNLGYLGCVKGAARARAEKEARGCDIPWAILLRLEAGQTWPFDEYARILQEGKVNGVVSYLFVCRDPLALGFLLRMMVKEPDCAFGLCLPPTLLTEEAVLGIKRLRNLMVAVDTEQQGFASAAERLRRHRCLYSGYRAYETEADAQEICNGVWAKKAAAAGCVFAVAYAGAACPGEICTQVKTALEQQRNQPEAQVMVMNYYTDYLQINQMISGGACLIGVLPDGGVTTCDGFRERPSGLNLLDLSLDQVLCRLNRRSGADETV